MTAVDKAILKLQKMEILQAKVYSKLASIEGDKSIKTRLETIAADEFSHYDFWAERTQKTFSAPPLITSWYIFIARVFGLSFCLNLLERKERRIAELYDDIITQYPEAAAIQEDEEKHEQLLLDTIQEEKLNYTGSFVLGLNDALIELTGVLAGLSLAFQDQKTIAVAGLVTGVAASLSMASSEYISKGAEGGDHNRLQAASYTGIAYFITVLLLIIPYFIITPAMSEAIPIDIEPYILSLSTTLGIAILIILCFNYYTTVALRRPFWGNFIEMLVLSMGVAAISFALGLGIRIWLGMGS